MQEENQQAGGLKIGSAKIAMNDHHQATLAMELALGGGGGIVNPDPTCSRVVYVHVHCKFWTCIVCLQTGVCMCVLTYMMWCTQFQVEIHTHICDVKVSDVLI